MTSNFNRPLRFEVILPSDHPHLLQGLDEWLRLNLISDVQVRQFCREYLVCKVILQAQTLPQRRTERIISPPSKPTGKEKVPATPNFFASMWQSLLAEFSVRWLLFLGMFTVVVSSGALAASQWERFTAFLQYGILFAYTLGFWGLSYWTSKQANLRLTSDTLHIVTMLLIPVNFWAMDSFGLWQNPVNWFLVGIASIILTGITVLLSKKSIFARTVPVHKLSLKLSLINILGLSYLHWGWKFSGFPLIAVYLAVIGTTIITIFQTLSRVRTQEVEKINVSQFSWGKNAPVAVIIYALILLLIRAIFGVGVDVTQLGLAVGICGWLIIWLAQKEDKGKRGQGDKETRGQGDKGKRGQEKISTTSSSTPSLVYPYFPIFPSQAIGGMLLLLGWLVTVGSNPLQAIAVSGLGLWLFNTRLHLYSLKRDLTAFFLVGLQSVWLGWRLLPAEFQSSIITTATQFTNSQNNPWALLSVGLFPYIIFMVAFTDNLRTRGKILVETSSSPSSHQQNASDKQNQQDDFSQSREQDASTTNKLDLANFGEILTLLLGFGLTAVGLENPTLRSLNLLLSTITLAIFTHRHFYKISSPPIPSSPDSLVYLTHISATLTICSWINLFFPNLSPEIWAVVCLVGSVTEWLFSVGDGVWRRSGWHIGSALAGVSYLLLLTNTELAWSGVDVNQASWGLTWLVIPVTLTVIGIRSREGGVNKQIISVLTIIFAQLLTLPLSVPRLINLAVGVAVMFVNTRYLRNRPSAVITVGFGLSFIIAAVWETGSLWFSDWFVFTAVMILCLWVIRKLLKRGNELANIYAVATDFWASTLCVCELLLISLHALWIYLSAESNVLPYAISTVIILLALSFRHFYESTNWTFYGIGWCVELVELYLIEILEFGVYEVTSNGSPRLIYLAIANIALGLITQLVGDWLESKHHPAKLPNRWHILPLLYAGFGVLLRSNTLENWTGLSTLAVALIVIGVGRRSQKLKPLLYLGVIGVSIAAYELLFYRFTQASGGAVGDAWILLATLATIIAYGYRLLSRWLTSYLRLSLQELKIFAHCHWVLGSALLITAITHPVQANWLALATGLLLSCYAIFQGRNSDELLSPLIPENITEAEIWVYIGLVEIACFRHFIPPTSTVSIFLQQIRPWIAGVSCIVGYILYNLPWERWGWSKKPWQMTAYILPLFYLWETRIQIYSISLLLVASYYIFLAKITTKFRFSYISLGLVNWVLWRWFIDLGLTDALWYISSIGLSLLYIAQFDSQLKLRQNKSYRHRLRMLGSGIICGYAIVFHQNTGLIPGILSLIAIFAGLGLRIRAFLYIGSATFLITSSYQLVILILRYSFLKWVVGLLVGIVLIFVAANFESRRQQFNLLLRNTNDEFQEWE